MCHQTAAHPAHATWAPARNLAVWMQILAGAAAAAVTATEAAATECVLATSEAQPHSAACGAHLAHLAHPLVHLVGALQGGRDNHFASVSSVLNGSPTGACPPCRSSAWEEGQRDRERLTLLICCKRCQLSSTSGSNTAASPLLATPLRSRRNLPPQHHLACMPAAAAAAQPRKLLASTSGWAANQVVSHCGRLTFSQTLRYCTLTPLALCMGTCGRWASTSGVSRRQMVECLGDMRGGRWEQASAGVLKLTSWSTRDYNRAPQNKAAAPPTWKLMDSGGRLHGLRSRVVAISSTLAVSVCSASPANCGGYGGRGSRQGFREIDKCWVAPC